MGSLTSMSNPRHILQFRLHRYSGFGGRHGLEKRRSSRQAAGIFKRAEKSSEQKVRQQATVVMEGEQKTSRRKGGPSSF
jgi:hypothetical protein